MDVAIISDQPAPYRVHVLRRLARELPDIRFHNYFTHRLDDTTHAWQLSLTRDDHAELRAWFEPTLALPYGRFFSWRAVRLFTRLRGEIEHTNTRLIILHGYADLARSLLIRWARASGIPLLLAGDSNIHAQRALPGWKARAKAMYLRWVLRNVSGLMPMGSAGRAYFRAFAEHGLPEFLFPYEPDYRLFETPEPAHVLMLRDQHRLSPRRKRFLFVGRLAPEKGIDVLCAAFERIAVKIPEWDLVIVGGDEFKDVLPRARPPEISDRYRLVPFASPEFVAAWMACCDVFVLPSRYEPWGVVVNEAVAAGLPVIATNTCGAAIELVHHNENGLHVAPGDVDALAEAMLTLADAPTRARMRAAAGPALARWRKTADPVEAVRQAIRQIQAGTLACDSCS